MTATECIKGRRSIRKFNCTPITHDEYPAATSGKAVEDLYPINDNIAKRLFSLRFFTQSL